MRYVVDVGYLLEEFDETDAKLIAAMSPYEAAFESSGCGFGVRDNQWSFADAEQAVRAAKEACIVLGLDVNELPTAEANSFTYVSLTAEYETYWEAVVQMGLHEADIAYGKAQGEGE